MKVENNKVSEQAQRFSSGRRQKFCVPCHGEHVPQPSLDVIISVKTAMGIACPQNTLEK